MEARPSAFSMKPRLVVENRLTQVSTLSFRSMG